MPARDPGAPLRPLRREVLLLCGFLLCVAIAIVVIVVPELSDGDAAGEPPAKPAGLPPPGPNAPPAAAP